VAVAPPGGAGQRHGIDYIAATARGVTSLARSRLPAGRSGGPHLVGGEPGEVDQRLEEVRVQVGRKGLFYGTVLICAVPCCGRSHALVVAGPHSSVGLTLFDGLVLSELHATGRRGRS